ncbi:MAG: hypothetical protein ACRYE8_00590 [Janthinobacterium lividum]
MSSRGGIVSWIKKRPKVVIPWLVHNIQKIIKNTNFISIFNWIPWTSHGMTANSIDRDLMIEFILAKKPYKSYAYYTLIRSLFKSPCNKIILIIDKQLLKSYLGLFRSIIFGTLSYLKLIKIFIYDEKDFVLDIKALKSNENYFWSYKINYFKKLINWERLKKRNLNGGRANSMIC